MNVAHTKINFNTVLWYASTKVQFVWSCLPSLKNIQGFATPCLIISQLSPYVGVVIPILSLFS